MHLSNFGHLKPCVWGNSEVVSNLIKQWSDVQAFVIMQSTLSCLFDMFNILDFHKPLSIVGIRNRKLQSFPPSFAVFQTTVFVLEYYDYQMTLYQSYNDCTYCTVFIISKQLVQKWYCWWLKSCTTWDVWNPIKNGINYLSTGAGFQPSTVSPYKSSKCSQQQFEVAPCRLVGARTWAVPWQILNGIFNQF